MANRAVNIFKIANLIIMIEKKIVPRFKTLTQHYRCTVDFFSFSLFIIILDFYKFEIAFSSLTTAVMVDILFVFYFFKIRILPRAIISQKKGKKKKKHGYILN